MFGPKFAWKQKLEKLVNKQVLTMWDSLFTGVIVWLPGLVDGDNGLLLGLVATDYGLEFFFYIWSGHYLFVHSVFFIPLKCKTGIISMCMYVF